VVSYEERGHVRVPAASAPYAQCAYWILSTTHGRTRNGKLVFKTPSFKKLLQTLKMSHETLFFGFYSSCNLNANW